MKSGRSSSNPPRRFTHENPHPRRRQRVAEIRSTGPAPIDDETVRHIEELEELAPLHNASAIRAARETLGPQLPMVAVFDTVFHRTIPAYARAYALAPELTDGGRVRRYGFHGISHGYMRDRYAHLTGTSPDRANIVTLHLESGCSAGAIREGRSMDTAMGFTPLEGLVMGIRSGDIDPAIVGYFIRHKLMDIERIEDLLNKHSGLLGLSGVSHDTRELMKHIDSDDRVRFAFEVFCYRARKYIGASSPRSTVPTPSSSAEASARTPRLANRLLETGVWHVSSPSPSP